MIFVRKIAEGEIYDELMGSKSDDEQKSTQVNMKQKYSIHVWYS